MPENAIKTYVGEFEEGCPEILVDINLEKYPLGRLRSSIEEMTNVLRDYSKTVGPKNKKKDDLHLNKHMMHLIRLYFMCNEILKTGDLHTYRSEEHELLMDIRNGKYRDEKGGVKPEFYVLLKDLEDKANEYYTTSKLPKTVNKEKIADFMFEVYKNNNFN